MKNPFKENDTDKIPQKEKPIGKDVEEDLKAENKLVLQQADEIYDSQIDASSQIDYENLESYFPDEKNIETYEPDLGHSWEQSKVFAGIFLGMRPIIFDLNNAPGWVFTLLQKDGRKKTGVASFQIKRFLTDNNVPIGCWISFEKIGEIPLKGGMRMSEFKVSYDMTKLKVRHELLAPRQVLQHGKILEKAKIAGQKELPF